MDDEGSFGTRLRVLRERVGLTQEELAERAGLSAKAVSLLERGERKRPYPHTVASLADALGLGQEDRAELAASVRRPEPSRTPLPTWPVPPTPLVGRDAELRDVQALLSTPGTRLVTLTGTGGVGKTRLALGVLAAAAAGFQDGAAFVPLAPVASADLVGPTVVRALGLTEGGRPPLEVLRGHLTGRRMLLVLDNFEHVLDAAAGLAELVALADGPVVLVTSRAPLRLRGEVEYAVSPLWTPDTRTPTVEAVSGSPAGRLFAERASAASAGFAINEGNAADVAAICRHLAGLPLALEIAAARSRVLGPSQLLARLDRALHEEGARDLPERHRTLRRTLDWSHDLLETSDQELLARLSVFAGGFTLEAAESVCGDLPDGADVLTALTHLVEQSLVVAEPDETGAVRYRMLEPVRQYAAERLEQSGRADEVHLAHARHFSALAEEAFPATERSDQIEWLDRLALENDNLRAAIAWSVESDHVELAVQTGWGLRMYWLLRDRRQDGLRLMERALPRADRLPDAVRARFFHVLAFCHYGFRGQQRGLAQQGLEIFRQLGDRRGEEYALGQLAFAHLVEGDFDAATSALRQAYALAEEYRDEAHQAHLLNHLAVVPLRLGDPARAAELAEQALERTRRTGERLAKQTSLQILAQAAWAVGEHARARAFFRQSLQVARELADPVNVGYCLRGLAISDGAAGATTWAAGLLGAADQRLEDAGYPLFAWAVGQLDAAVGEALRRTEEDDAWLAAYERGRAAEVDDVVQAADLEPG